jgi:hypothetical protein
VLDELGRWEEAEASYRRAIELGPGDALVSEDFGGFLLFCGVVGEAREHLGLQGGTPQGVLLRWAADRSWEAGSDASTVTPQSILAALEAPWPSNSVTPSMFGLAEIRALALAGCGQASEAVRVLRAATSERRPRERFRRPLYDLLSRPDPVAGLDGLLEVWWEIIAVDPSAAGPWGGPDPA